MSRNTDKSMDHRPFHDRIKPRLIRRTGTAFLPVSVRMRMLRFEFIRTRIRRILFLIERWGRAASRSRGTLTLEYLLSGLMRGRNTVLSERGIEYLSSVFHRSVRVHSPLNIRLQSHLNIDGPTVVSAETIHREARSSHRVSRFPEQPVPAGASRESKVPIEHLSGMRRELGGRIPSRDRAADPVKRSMLRDSREKATRRHAPGYGRGLRLSEAARARRAATESTVLRPGDPPPGSFLQRRAAGTSEQMSPRGVFGRHGDDDGHRRTATQEGPMRTNIRFRVDRRVSRPFAPPAVPGTEPATGPSDTAGPGRGGRSAGVDRVAGVGGAGSDLNFIHAVSPGGQGSPQPDNDRRTLSAASNAPDRDSSPAGTGFSGGAIGLAKPRGLADRPPASGQPVSHQTMTWIVNEVYAQMEDRLRTERERRGIF